MTTHMKVKDLIELLQKVDPELPVHRFKNGECPPVEIEYAGHWLNYDNLMQHKIDSDYYSLENDKIWSKHKDQFNPPFKAVVFW